MRRNRPLFLVVLLTLLAVIVWLQPAWWGYLIERSVYEGRQATFGEVVTEHRYPFWGEPTEARIRVTWTGSTGMRESLSDPKGFTVWDEGGVLIAQDEGVLGGPEMFQGPPWRRGMTDMNGPDAPWVRAGLALDEWWAALSESRKIGLE